MQKKFEHLSKRKSEMRWILVTKEGKEVRDLEDVLNKRKREEEKMEEDFLFWYLDIYKYYWNALWLKYHLI